MKSLKIAGVSGVIILILMILSMISVFIITFTVHNPFINALSSNESFENALNNSLYISFEEEIQQYQERQDAYYKSEIVFLTLSSFFSIFFLWGFVLLGRKFNNKIMSVIAQIMIGVFALIFILSLRMLITGNFYFVNIYPDEDFSFLDPVKQGLMSAPLFGTFARIVGGVLFWPLLIFFALSHVALHLLLGISIMNLKKHKIRFSQLAGAFEIASIFEAFSFLSILFESIIFFNIAKEEEIKKI